MKTIIRFWPAVAVAACLLTPLTALGQDAPAPASSTSAATSAMDDLHAMHDMSSNDNAHKEHKPTNATGKAAHEHMPMDPQPGSASEPSSMSRKDMGSMKGMAHDDMTAMDMRAMQGGDPPADARDPDYSDGIRFNPGNDAHMMGMSRFAMLLVDRLEYLNGRSDHGTALEAQGWYGGDLEKLAWKVEGEYGGGRIEDLRTELLWSHAVSAHWDTQLGVRHDEGEGPQRNWAAFGIQGLAPYWFELDATAYVGPAGRTAARLEAEYEILFTQRLILTPKVELNAFGKDDPARGIGSGLSNAGFGLRLRYEVRRRFAPYVGIEWQRRLGNTAELARWNGTNASETLWVAGVRLWF